MKIRVWWDKYRLEAILAALLAVVAVVAAFYFNLIPWPLWGAAPAESDKPLVGARAAASAAASTENAKVAAMSANFAADGAAKSAIASASSASAAKSSEKNAAAHEVRAKQAAERAEAAAGKTPVGKPQRAKSMAKARKSLKPMPVAKAAPTEPPAVEPGASGGFRWLHFGVAPYASSREEAMSKRMSAFRSMGLPSAVVTQLLFVTDMPSERARIVPGDHLDAMLSKGGAVHRDVTVAFEPPVHGMEFTAVAEKWQVTWGGKTYTVLLPEVCNNWSLVIGQAPLTPLQAVEPPPPTAAPPVATSSECPEGWTLFANAWTLASLPSELRHEAETLIAAANARDSDNARRLEPYKPDDVSRTLGKRLREQVRVRAPVTGVIQIRLLDPTTGHVVRDLGTMRLNDGVGTYRFQEDPRKYVVETLWPLEYVSPVTSAGWPRLRLFGYEWKGICAMNEHGLR